MADDSDAPTSYPPESDAEKLLLDEIGKATAEHRPEAIADIEGLSEKRVRGTYLRWLVACGAPKICSEVEAARRNRRIYQMGYVE